MTWAKEIFDGNNNINLNIANNKENESSVEISNAKEGKIEDLKIYGNSIQNEEETSEIESVGELVTNENDGKFEK